MRLGESNLVAVNCILAIQFHVAEKLNTVEQCYSDQNIAMLALT
jgi:hypothetical protein